MRPATFPFPFPLALAVLLYAWPGRFVAAAAPLSGVLPSGPAIYAGGPLYSGGQAVTDELGRSGFATVVAWTVHVDGDGGLSFNERPLVAGGRYLGDPGWPDRLASLKAGQVSRLLFSVGSAGSADFHHLQALLQDGGAGADGVLRRNFQALLRAIPTLDGFDLDDEDLLDRPTTVAFGRMVGELGGTVTFCPYADPDYWAGCLRELEQSSPGLVSAVHLQCYAGSAWNDPQGWIAALGRAVPGLDAAARVRPGLWCRHGDGCAQGDAPEAVRDRFLGWRGLGLRGGFIWLYDDLQACRGAAPSAGAWTAEAYAAAIRSGLGDGSGGGPEKTLTCGYFATKLVTD
jgi:hypothetical protein